MKIIAVIALAAALAGCGTAARSTGAMQLGPDTYRVAARAPMGSVAESQRMALTEAQAHCKAAAKDMMVTGTRRLDEPGGGPFEVTFQCLASGDPALQRPNLQPSPTAVIQVK